MFNKKNKQEMANREPETKELPKLMDNLDLRKSLVKLSENQQNLSGLIKNCFNELRNVLDNDFSLNDDSYIDLNKIIQDEPEKCNLILHIPEQKIKVHSNYVQLILDKCFEIGIEHKGLTIEKYINDVNPVEVIEAGDENGCSRSKEIIEVEKECEGGFVASNTPKSS